MLVPDREVPGAFVVRIGGADQSFVDPADPLRLEFDYVQQIADVVNTMAPVGQRLSVVHVGGAGMTIPRYVAATRPTSAQIVLEPDAGLTEQVRSVMPLARTSGIKVRAVDGRTGLAELRADYADLVVVDAFAGAQVPAELGTAEWFTDIARVLKSGGTCVMNLTDSAPFLYARRIAASFLAHFSPVVCAAEPSTLKGRRFGNLVMTGGSGADYDRLVRRAAGSAFPYRLLDLAWLRSWASQAVPFTDADAEPSPYPPHGPTAFR